MDRFRMGLQRILHDRRSGSSAIAIKFCRLCLAELGKPRARVSDSALTRDLKELVGVFPTMALLRTLQDRLRRVNSVRIQAQSEPDRERFSHVLASFLDDLHECRRQAASRFVATACDHKSFLTLSASGAVLEACAALAKHVALNQPRAASPAIVVCESRPAREGVAMARKLHRASCRVTLITDAAMGGWIGNVDAVILGADWIDRNGFVNKTGSLAVSQLALLHRKPVYVIGDSLRIRKKVLPASQLPDADPAEVLKRQERGLAVENRYFERIPWNTSHVFVTEAGCSGPRLR